MLINNIGSSKNVYYYNEWYDDTGWNRRSEFPDPPASPAPNIGTNSNNNLPESLKSPPLKNITAHHKICFIQWYYMLGWSFYAINSTILCCLVAKIKIFRFLNYSQY